MKKVLFAAFLMISSSTIFAQVNQGQWLVGGNIGFTSEKFGDAKLTTFNFSPDAGYFFINNFAGGLRFDITSAKPDGGDASTSTLIAPFVRYYFLPAAQKVNILLDGSYGFGSIKSGGGSSQSLSGFAFMAGPAIFLTPNTALEITLGYKSLKYKDVSDRDNSFGVNVGFQVHLGQGNSGGSKK